MKYYIASTPYNTQFVVIEDSFPMDMPPGFVFSGWPPFECDSQDPRVMMEKAMAHVTECEYLKLWHIYMN